MGYQSRTIKQVLPDINESIFLPAIQREFVWDTEQIVQLFDSVLREYPIGSFIFWNLNGEFADNQIGTTSSEITSRIASTQTISTTFTTGTEGPRIRANPGLRFTRR